MRGRSLNDSFVILDEAQNTSVAQMKMFLTRIGFGSRAVVTGDITQIDLPSGQLSGLKNAIEILEKVDGIVVYVFHAQRMLSGTSWYKKSSRPMNRTAMAIRPDLRSMSGDVSVDVQVAGCAVG